MVKMRSILVALIIVFSLVLVVGAATSICPFDIPTQGHYIVTKQTVGTVQGAMNTNEGTTYSDENSVNSYQFSALAIGGTQFASTLSTDVDFITSEKALSQSAVGVAQIDEEYAQMAISRDVNLSFNDLAAGGTYGVISPGDFASTLTLNKPVDLIYQAAYGGPDSNSGMANGMARVWMSALGQEGYGATVTNATDDTTSLHYIMTAQQETHQSVNFYGNFQFATIDSIRITHPFAKINSSLTSLAQFPCAT